MPEAGKVCAFVELTFQGEGRQNDRWTSKYMRTISGGCMPCGKKYTRVMRGQYQMGWAGEAPLK